MGGVRKVRFQRYSRYINIINIILYYIITVTSHEVKSKRTGIWLKCGEIRPRREGRHIKSKGTVYMYDSGRGKKG